MPLVTLSDFLVESSCFLVIGTRVGVSHPRASPLDLDAPHLVTEVSPPSQKELVGYRVFLSTPGSPLKAP